jgi:type II secretory pathway pseudopilin PulG
MRQNGGFTIIEVMLFLAVSSLLLGTMVFGTYSMIFNSRFTDTISSAASFLQKQYEEARSGVRPAPEVCGSIVGKSSYDVLIGKLVIFNYENEINTINAYYVLGDAITFETPNKIDDINNPSPTVVYDRIKSFHPRAIDCGEQETELAWSAKFACNSAGSTCSGMFGYTDSNGNLTPDADLTLKKTDFNALLLVRNPYSADLRTYTLKLNLVNFNAVGVDEEGARDNSNIFDVVEIEATLIGSKSVIIIKNGDSLTFRSLGVLCVDPGSNSTAVYGARGLEVPVDGEGDPNFSKIVPNNIAQTVSDKCAL